MKTFLPLIKKSNGRRIGKGFSLNELKLADLSKHDVKKYKIPFDKRRKSFYTDNIEVLKTINKEKLSS